jgi:hypothetical protein
MDERFDAGDREPGKSGVNCGPNSLATRRWHLSQAKVGSMTHYRHMT